MNLLNQPLPVCIPNNVKKYPPQWCLNDGCDYSFAPQATYSEIALFESHLEPFVRISQAVIGNLIRHAMPRCGPIRYGNYDWWPIKLMHAAKYGPPEPQEVALGFLASQGSRVGLSLGEVKALIYISSRDGRPFMGVLDNLEAEKKWFARIKSLAEASWFEEEATKYAWGGDLAQFKPILKKALGLYEGIMEGKGMASV